MRTALLILLVACSGPATQAPPVAPVTAVAAMKFGDGLPLATPGERMTYRVVLGNVDLAVMTLAIGDVTELGGKRAVVVQGHAKSVGLANMIAAIDDTFTSWIDVTTGRSLRFAVDEYETNSKTNVEHAIADFTQATATSLPFTFALNDAAPVPEPQTLSLPDPWDYNAFLLAVRAWEAPVGTTHTLEVARSRYLWHMEVTVGGKERLTTELGDLPTVKFAAKTYKIDRAGQRVMDSAERVLTIWISDDDDRVPLLITSGTDYGDVKIQIAEYIPGTGTRLRP